MMTKKTTVFAVLTLLWGLFIFFNSLQNGDTSTKVSDSVVSGLPDLFSSFSWNTLTIIVRKAAHVGEYFLFSLLCHLAFYYGGGLKLKNWCTLLFPGLLWAVADEFIQTFVEGRTGMVKDVLIDFSGVVAASLIVFIIVALRKKHQKKSNKEYLTLHSS